jgi:hypothetical protein
MVLAAESSYVVTMILLKIAIGLFFYRLTVLPHQRLAIIVVIAVTGGFGTAFFLFTIFQCGPWQSPDEFIHRFMMEPCQPRSLSLGMNYTQGILNAITDLLCAVFPLNLIRQSRLSRREKIAVTILILIAML